MKFIFLLLCTTVCFADNAPSGYEIVEDKAGLPLLNPSLSGRKISKLRLDNGLEVYLLSDPGADQSAAALSVEAGSWEDPKEYPGMAHFLEHMLFMGTAAYPQEFEYMQYVADNGGKVNAATWPDHTSYMFSVNNAGFEGALDRFSHFFIDPLFSRSCIDRELLAVDQEHSKNIEHDGCRQYMIFKETGNPAHPNAGFSTGNAKTLSGIPQAALKQWYHDHYSADRMHLIVVSPLSVEEMTRMVLRYFSPIPNTMAIQPVLPDQMCSPQQKGRMIYVKPIKDLRLLSLTWELPTAFAQDQDKKVIDLVAHVLSSDSKNSLLQQLKGEKIAESIRVSADRFGKDHILFSIDIGLTEHGLYQIDTAILRCFQALAHLKETGISQKLFEEMQQMRQLNYQYQSRSDAFSFVIDHSTDILYENLETYPEKTHIPLAYDPAFISLFLHTLTPESCLYFVLTDPAPLGIATERREKWMEAEYTIKEISEAKLTAWNQAATHPQIGTTPLNPFIPTQLALLTSTSAPSIPSLIADDETGQAYFAQDTQYLVPETIALFGFKTPLIDGSARATALTDLYLKALKEKLSTTLFFAKTAGISAGFCQEDLKLRIDLHGYSEKSPLVLKEIFQALKNVAPTKEQFDIYRQMLLSSYDNQHRELPFWQVRDLLASIIYNDAPTGFEKFRALKMVTYEEFLQFSAQLFKTSYAEALFFGNLSENDAVATWKSLKTAVASTPYPRDKHIEKRVLTLPEKHGPYMVMQHTERKGNAVYLLIEEGAFSFEKRGAQQLLGKVLQDAFFDTLRTKQQTAYIAKAWDSEVQRQLLQLFAVQSSTHHPSELIARFELFLEDFLKNYEDRFSRERFETVRDVLVTTLQMPPENLEGMAARLNKQAFDYQGDFRWIDKRVESVKALTYEQVRSYAEQFFSRDNGRRLAILMEGALTNDSDFRYERVTKEDVCDLGTYVSWK
jgi:insulysin